jgi:hypothetical protein
MSDLGKKQLATKKKVRSQFRIHANREIEKLSDVSVKGKYLTLSMRKKFVTL